MNQKITGMMVGGSLQVGAGEPQMLQPPSPVALALSELSEAISGAHIELSGLIDRLRVVRTISGTDGEKAMPSVGGACPVEESLSESIRMVRGLIERIQTTKSELRI